MSSQRFSGIQKAAIFFLSIDEDAIVEIFRHMEPWEVEQITCAVAHHPSGELFPRGHYGNRGGAHE
jgi:flagellar motor switch protein FliG